MAVSTSTRQLFGQIAVAKGYITERQLDACLREQQTSSIEVGQIFLQRGLITTDQFLEILLLQERFVLVCRECNRSYNIFGYRRGDVFPCGHCGKSLEVPTTAEEMLSERVEAPKRPALGRYQIVREIARGSMGLILEALDTRLQRVVALKVLKEGECEPKALERLHREAQAVAKLRHPNIVSIHDIGSEDGVHYFAMDFVDGGSFDKMIDAPGRRVRELVAVLETVTRAVHYAHEQGVVHRDLKPHNILIDRDGRPVVSDFGLARVEETSLLLTRSGTAVGTPYYMPPEQVLGKHAEIDARSDVWGLGIILYQILTKRVPFEGETPVEIFRRILSENPEKPGKLHPGIDADLEIVCLKALEKGQKDRYQTAFEFAEDLRRWLDGQPILAHRRGTITRAMKRVRRNFAGVAAVTLAIVLIPVGLLLLRATKERREQRARAEREKQFSELFTPAAGQAEALLAVSKDSLTAEMLHAKAEQTLAEFDRPRALEPDDPWIRIYRGRLLHLLGRDDEAEIEYQAAGGIGSASFYLGQLYVKRYLKERGDPDLVFEDDKWRVLPMPEESEEARRWRRKAADSLAKPASLKPHQSRYLEGMLAFGKGDYARAASHLEAYSLEEWLDVDALELLGRAQFLAGRAEEAEPSLSRGLRLSPARASLFHYRGMVRELRNDLEGAEKDYTRSIELDPTDAKTLNGRGVVRYFRSDFKGAIDDYEKSAKLDPSNADLFVNMGQARRSAGDPAGAVDDLTKALNLRPKAEAYAARGHALLDLGKWKEAVSDYGRAIELAPKSPGAYVNRGLAWERLREYEKALPDFTRAIEVDQNYAPAYNNRGNLRRETGNLDGAIWDLTQAISLDPKLAEAYANRAIVLDAMGNTLEALGDLATAIELEPRNAGLHVDRALIHLHRGHPDKAIGDYTRAIEVDPKHVNAYVNRGLVFWTQGKNQEAFGDFSKAIELDTKDPRAYLGRGLSYLANGRDDMAFEDLTRSIALDKRNPEAYHNRAQIYLGMGEFERAIGDLTHAIEYAPDASSYRSRGEARRDLAFRKSPFDKEFLRQAIDDFKSALDLEEDDAERAELKELIAECRRKLGE